MMQILDLRERFRTTVIAFVAEKLSRYNQSTGEGIVIGSPFEPADVYLEAEVNAHDLAGRHGWQGRWIVNCPCGGAEYVDLENQVFMCCSCWNRDRNHQWVKVRMPRFREQIESELVKRPGRNRFWKPGETLKQLRAENAKHGVR